MDDSWATAARVGDHDQGVIIGSGEFLVRAGRLNVGRSQTESRRHAPDGAPGVRFAITADVGKKRPAQHRGHSTRDESVAFTAASVALDPGTTRGDEKHMTTVWENRNEPTASPRCRETLQYLEGGQGGDEILVVRAAARGSHTVNQSGRGRNLKGTRSRGGGVCARGVTM